MTLSIAFRAALGIALLTAMDGVIKGQMQQHPFIVALFMRFLMGGLCALAALAIARPARPTRNSVIGNLVRIPTVVLTAMPPTGAPAAETTPEMTPGPAVSSTEGCNRCAPPSTRVWLTSESHCARQQW